MRFMSYGHFHWLGNVDMHMYTKYGKIYHVVQEL